MGLPVSNLWISCQTFVARVKTGNFEPNQALCEQDTVSSLEQVVVSIVGHGANAVLFEIRNHAAIGTSTYDSETRLQNGMPVRSSLAGGCLLENAAHRTRNFGVP